MTFIGGVSRASSCVRRPSGLRGDFGRAFFSGALAARAGPMCAAPWRAAALSRWRRSRAIVSAMTAFFEAQEISMQEVDRVAAKLLG